MTISIKRCRLALVVISTASVCFFFLELETAMMGPPALKPGPQPFVLTVTGQHLGLLCTHHVKFNVIMMKRSTEHKKPWECTVQRAIDF
jgi:hypothetical protein